MKSIVVLFAGLLVVLHQDFWWWHRVEPLVVGFIPIGLAWHVGISVMAAVLAAMIVRYCRPVDLDGFGPKHGFPEDCESH